jgi:hypothetical protein
MYMIHIKEYFEAREQGNIAKVHIVSKPIIPLRMLQLETVAEYYVREPEYLYIQDKDELMCEVIFQCVLYYPNCAEIAWSVYADDREGKNIEQVIIRHSVWNKEKEIQKIKGNSHENREKIAMLPDISTYTHRCNVKEASCVVASLAKLDACFSNGIALTDNTAEIEAWSDVELQRRLSWGTVRSVWNQRKRWEGMAQLKIFLAALEELVDRSSFVTADSIELDFMFPMAAYVKHTFPYAENLEKE